MVKLYSTTTAPPPMRLHGAQSGGTTTFCWAAGDFSGFFRTARSTARASTPSKQVYTPRARNSARNTVALLQAQEGGGLAGEARRSAEHAASSAIGQRCWHAGEG